jgi:hypothetical protein
MKVEIRNENSFREKEIYMQGWVIEFRVYPSTHLYEILKF